MGAAAFQPSGFARLWEAKTVPMTSATVDINLMKMSRQGPTVSLSGSPTVSPTTAASCSGLPLPAPSTAPASMDFLLLSQAPPALPVKMAIMMAQTVEPMITPPTNSGPKMKPQATGTTTASSEGTFISPIAPLEEISMQVL